MYEENLVRKNESLTDCLIEQARKEELKTGLSEAVKGAKGIWSAYGIGFVEGGNWMKGIVIEKAVEWLKDNDLFRAYPQPNGTFHYMKRNIIEDFKKAMMEG